MRGTRRAGRGGIDKYQNALMELRAARHRLRDPSCDRALTVELFEQAVVTGLESVSLSLSGTVAREEHEALLEAVRLRRVKALA